MSALGTTPLPARPLSPGLVDRLVCAKYLVQLASEAVEQPTPYSTGVAVLGFHDGVEMVLRVIAEAVGALVQKETAFHSLIDAIDKAVPGDTIKHRSSLNQLNQARVSFKHAGNKPDLQDCLKFRGDVLSFFRSALPSYLGLDYDEVSMVQLITHRRTRNHLRSAETKLANGLPGESVQASAIAFQVFRRHVRDREGRTSARSYGSELRSGGGEQSDFDSSVIEGLADRLEKLEEKLEILTDCVNPADYARFERLTPEVALSVGGAPWVVWSHNGPDEPTMHEAAFCFRFVLDSIFEMQKRAVPSRFREFKDTPDRTFLVVKACEVLAYIDEDPEVLREASVGEKLKGHFAIHDSRAYIAVVQDGDVAFVSREAVEPVEPQTVKSP